LCAACGHFQGAGKTYREVLAQSRQGDLAKAAAEALRDAERWHGNGDSPWYWNFRLLAAETLTSQGKYPEAEKLLEQPVPQKLDQQYARWLIARANLNVARFRDATDLLRQARAVARDPELVIRVNISDGIQALNQRHSERAQELFLTALDQATRSNDIYQQAVALSDLCYSSRRLNRNEEAIQFGERAVKAAEQAGARRIEAAAHNNLGTAYSLLGEFDAAIAHEQKAVETNRAMGSKPAAMQALGEVARIYDSANQSAKSVPYYQQAFQMAQELGSKRDATRFAENLTTALIKLEQWQQATEWNERARVLAAETGENLAYLLRNQALIADGTGRTEESARLYHQLLAGQSTPDELRWVAYTRLGDIDAAAKRFGQANREYEQALAIIDNSRASLTDARFKITLVSYLMVFYRHYVDALARENDDDRALKVVESSRARVLAERMGRDFEPRKFPDLAGLRRWAGAERATVLSFWVAPKRSFAWVIRADGVKRVELPADTEIEALVTDYRAAVEHTVRDPLQADAKLWKAVMAPVAAAIPPGSRVIVIADGPLHRLNLETLVRPEPKPHYWIEDAEIEVAPSITIAMGKAGEARGAEGVLLIGDPDYQGTGYEPLSGAGEELKAIASRFGSVRQAVYRGAQATPAAYRAAEPGRFAVIHFAAHAEADPEKPLESAVVLARAGDGYKLYARDVIGIPIHAGLVTLSACRSAGAREYAGEGLIGFAWAFLQAGAGAVVAGLWDVSDQAAVPLMARFYEGVAAGREPAAALRAAKLDMLHGEAHFSRAFYWGAFQVYVGGAGR
jgi:CHAT domain-containing protein